MKGQKVKENVVNGIKGFSLKAVSGVEVTPDMLALINKFALQPLTAEQVYVRKWLMAHNGVDRDNERFPELVLQDFAMTLPGKSLLNGHDRKSLPLGLYFDAKTEDISPDQFKAFTGEDVQLPAGMSAAKVLYGWIYMLKAPFNDAMVANIDAGIYRHASIGFGASDIVPVKGPQEQVLYWEYVGPAEAQEGSIVWLGAQQGATSQKKVGGDEEDTVSHKPSKVPDGDHTKQGGHKKMKELIDKLKILFPGRVWTEENLHIEIKTLVDESAGSKDGLLSEKDAKIKELSSAASDGKAYRDDLVVQYVTNKAKLGECTETPEAQAAVKSVASTYPIAFLKTEVEALIKRVTEKFPDTAKLKGDDTRDKSEDGEKKNVLIPPDEKEDK
jgi:hypothetical protein